MKKKEESLKVYPPVVSVLGHVDHGKTTLLDKIRETAVAKKELGGITQKIGASQIEIEHEGVKRKITFIDTPGHEAFSNMRSQGVNAADIALLIVAADDGIKPQTKESIEKIKEANIPYIVVFTKTDLDTANIDKVKQQVLSQGVLLEGLGGDVPYIGVSAVTGEKVKDLLDLILLVYDLSSIKKDDTGDFMGVIIDSKLDKRRGSLASVVVKQGKLSVGKTIFAHGFQKGKIRALIDTFGKNTDSAIPGDAVEVLGLSEVLPSGTVLFDKEVEPEIRKETQIAPASAREAGRAKQVPSDILEFLKDEEPDIIPIILKSETSAEMEALKNSLPPKVRIIYEGQGDIAISDILLAKDFGALVIAFNVDITHEAKQLAQNEKVFYKSYGIIYKLLEELADLIAALIRQEEAKVLGEGQILTSFLGSSGPILGIKVNLGRLARGDKIKILRGQKEMGTAEITSVRHGKADVKQAEKGTECGVVLRPQIDFAPGDAIIAYSKK